MVVFKWASSLYDKFSVCKKSAWITNYVNVLGFFKLKFKEKLFSLQGQPGLEGPVGPEGYDGCNGTKVRILFNNHIKRWKHF